MLHEMERMGQNNTENYRGHSEKAQSCFAFSSDSLHPTAEQVCLSALISQPGIRVY